MRRCLCGRGALCLVATAMLSAVTFPGAAVALNFLVTKEADTADGVCDADCSLREAIIAANANPGDDVVTVPAGTYVLTIAGADGEDASANGDLDIASGGLTISGAGAATTIVDGNDAIRPFEVVGTGTVIFAGLTIRNGLGGFGGGIENDNSGATVTIDQCIIQDNHANFFGGGVNNNAAGSISITNSTITGNTAGSFGGGINNNVNGSITIDETVISGNMAAGFGGGGLNNNSNGTMTITQSAITGNSAGNGAGINNNGAGSLMLDETTVSGNTATSSIGGGGILNNSSGPLSVVESTISGNNAAGPGAGIANNSSGTVTIENSTISGNTTTDTDGGGGIYKNSNGTAALTNVTMIGNSAPPAAGGALANNVDDAGLSVLRSIVANSVSGGNCAGTITSLGVNLSNDASCVFTAGGDLQNMDPQAAALASNGGPTQTHALQSGSPAIDAGGGGCPPPAADQRGVSRAQGSACEIGSFECGPDECAGLAPTATPTPTLGAPTATPTATATATVTATATATVIGVEGEGPPAIPALSAKLLLLLGATLAAAGFLVLRSRS